MSPPLSRLRSSSSASSKGASQQHSLVGVLGTALLCLWLFAAPTQFTGLTSGDYNYWPQTLALLLLAGVALLASVAGARVRLDGVSACLLGFLGWNVLATLTGVYAHDAWLETARVSGVVGVFFLARALSTRLDTLAMALALGAILAAGEAIFDFFSTHNTAQQGTFPNQNLFAAMLSPALWLSLLIPLALWRRSRSLAYALVGLAPALCLSLALALTSSKGGFLGALVALLVLLGGAAQAQGPRLGQALRRTWPVLLVLALVFGAVGAKTVGPRLLRARGSENNSTQFRRYVWKSTLTMIEARPLTGWGPGSFPSVYPRFALAGYTRMAHQSWLQIAAESGLPALVLLLGAIALAVRDGWRKLKTTNWAHSATGLAALAAILVHGCTDSGWGTIAVGACLSLSLALCADEPEIEAPRRGLSPPFLGATLVLLLGGYGTKNVASAEDVIAAGNTLLRQGLRPGNAGEAVALDPGSARAWRFVARATPLDERSTWQSAFDKALQLQPDNGNLVAAYAGQLAALPAPTGTDLTQTNALYDRAVGLDPLNTSLRLERAKWRLDHKDGRGYDDLEFVLGLWDAPYGKYQALGRETNVNLDFARATLALAPRLKAQRQDARLKTLVARALDDCAAARTLQKSQAELLQATRGSLDLGNFGDLDALESGLHALQLQP